MRKRIYLFLSTLLLSFSWAWADAVFHEDFTNQAAFDAWTQKDAPWSWIVGNQIIQGHGLNTASALIPAGSETTGSVLVSPGFTLVAGKTYNISFWGRRASGAILELYAGTDAGTITTTGTKLLYTPDLGTTSTTQSSYNYRAITGGTYHLGFKGITTDPYLFIDDINIEEVEVPSDIITEFPFAESFDAATYPNWTTEKKVGASITWARNTTTAYVHSGTASIKHNYNSTAGVQSGWLISPQFVLGAGKSYKLKFWSRNQYPGDYTAAKGAKNSVLISTAGKDTTNFTTEVWSPASVADSWVESDIDLSSYAGQSIYIAFRYRGNNSHAWNLDDVSIEEVADYNVGVTEIVTPKSGWDLGNETVSVKIKNAGSQPATNFPVRFIVDTGVYVEETFTETIAPNTEAVFTFTAKADLSVGGPHTIKVYTAWANDAISGDDAKERTVTNTACAGVTSVSENFTAVLSECWQPITNNTQNASYFARYNTSGAQGYVWRFASISNVTGEASDRFYQYLIAPTLAPTAKQKDVSFKYQRAQSYTEKFRVGYSTTTRDLTAFTWLETVSDATTEWKEYRTLVPGNAKYVAINYNVDVQTTYLYIDDIVIKEASDVDAAVKSILGLQSGLNLPSDVSIKAHVENYGLQTLNSLTVKYQINANAPVAGSITSLASGAGTDYEFPTKADLSADGAYTIKVWVEAAGDTDLSNDTITVQITNTVCTPVSSFPWSEGFEDLPLNTLRTGCWSATNLNSYTFINPASTYWGSAPRTGSGYAYFRYYANDSITTQPFAFTGGQAYKFSLWYASENTSSGHELYASLYKVSDNSFVQRIGSPVTSVTPAYQEYEGLFTPETTGEYYIVIKAKVTGSPYYIAIDDLEVRELLLVPDAGVTAITAPVNGVNLSQQEVTVTVKNYGGVELPATTPVAYTLNGGTEVVQSIGSAIAIGGTLNVSFTTLAADFVEGDNVIKAYTKADGDADVTNDTTTDTIYNTICAPLTRLSEDFNSPLSPCWVIVDGNGDNVTWTTQGGGHSDTSTDKAIRYGYSASGVVGNDWLFSPQVQLEAAKQYTIKFWYKRHAVGDQEKLAFYITPDPTIAAATADPANKLWSQEVDLPTVWTEYEQVITGYEGNYGFAFQAYSDGYKYYIYLDDFSVEPIVANDLTVTEVTTAASGVNLSATAPVSVKIKNLGTQPASGFAVKFDVDGNVAVGDEIYSGEAIAPQAEITYPFTATADLSAGGNHTIKAYIALAGDENLANDTLPVTVKNTICELRTLPFTEDFETAVTEESLSPCWKDNYHTPQNTNHTTDGQWGWRLNANGNLYLITPELQTTETSKVVTYWMWAYTNAPWTVGYSTTDNEVTSFTGNTQVETSTFPGNEAGWKQYSFVVPGNTKYVIFQNTGEFTLFLDDIKIDLVRSIVTTTPAADATGVSIALNISVVFDQPITLVNSGAGITVKAGDNAFPVVIAKNDSTLNINHTATNPFVHNTVYTVTVPAGSIEGLQTDTVWSFTTATALQPTYTPSKDATNVPVNTAISVSFDRAPNWASSPRPQDVKLFAGDQQVEGISVAYSVSDNKITITLQEGSTLEYNTDYDVEIKNGSYVDQNDYPGDITWSFKTEAAPEAIEFSPVKGATDVSVTSTTAFSIQFDKSIAGSSLAGITINDEPITAELASGWYSGSDILSSKVLLRPTLDYGTDYTIVIPTTAINGLSEDIVWTFSTEEELSYTTTPEDNDSNVTLDAEVAIEFNKEVTTWAGGFGLPRPVRPVITITDAEGNAVSGVDFVNNGPVSPSSKVVINHDAFEYGKTYTVSVPSNVVGAYDAQNAGTPITWSFTTLQNVGIHQVSTGSVYAANQKLHVSNYELGTSVAVYTVTGNLLTSQKVVDKELVIDLVQGAYIVNVQSKGQTVIHKVLVK
ncbi:hypothetical protein FACS189413_09130 [Bacteroidia bacterium]|nr:hypothetical protein FACS189413_09130 [Bacteroidia bacterium]